ncbi:hypothetical protein X975_17133, partial [Stegodyphus mimosarum]
MEFVFFDFKDKGKCRSIYQKEICHPSYNRFAWDLPKFQKFNIYFSSFFFHQTQRRKYPEVEITAITTQFAIAPPRLGVTWRQKLSPCFRTRWIYHHAAAVAAAVVVVAAAVVAAAGADVASAV